MPTKRRCQVKTTAAAALASAAAANTTGAAPRRPSDPLVVPVSGEIDALLLHHQRPLVHLRADRPAIDDFHSASRHSRLSASHPVSYTHLRAHETRHDLVCRLLLE